MTTKIERAMKPARHIPEPENKPTFTAYIPYINNAYGCLSRMLAKYNIKSVALPHRKIASYLPPVKDAIGLKHQEYTGSHASAVLSTSDRVVGQLTYA